MMDGRVFKFKAWNIEEQLLVRLNSIGCQKGKLVKEGHILLMFTGFKVRGGVEVYEQDILLVDSDKYLVVWDQQRHGWIIRRLSDMLLIIPSAFEFENAIRLCSSFESRELS